MQRGGGGGVDRIPRNSRDKSFQAFHARLQVVLCVWIVERSAEADPGLFFPPRDRRPRRRRGPRVRFFIAGSRYGVTVIHGSGYTQNKYHHQSKRVRCLKVRRDNWLKCLEWQKTCKDLFDIL